MTDDTSRRPAAGDEEIDERARRIRLILMDVDGVLTDGRLYYTEGGETKVFDVRDGAGIKLAQRAGLLTGIISGRESDATLRRAEELEMTEIHQQVPGKESAYLEIVERLGLSDEQVCYIGDDLVDIPVMKRVGLPAAPGDAHPCILPYAVLLAAAPGGRGAVREVVDRILRAQGRWHEVTEPYL